MIVPKALTASLRACYKDAVSVRIMKSHPKINGVTKKRVFRVLAVLFLVYTGFDLTVPGVCSEEFSVPGIVEVSTPVNGPSNSLDYVTSHTQFPQDQPSKSLLTDDDCFCCCSHVLRGNAPTLIITERLECFVIKPFTNPLLSPPLASPFHPPR